MRYLTLLFLSSTLAGCDTRSKANVAKAEAEEIAVLTAIEAFKLDGGSFPAPDNAAVVAPLLGHSPKGTVYIKLDANSFDDRGSFLDPWGNPYRFTFGSKAEPVSIKSAGPDRKFDTPDDVSRTQSK